MPRVSMTVFNDFLVKSGAPKQTVVSNAKKAGKYDPAHDFWKELRDAIVKMHTGGLSVAELSKVQRRIRHPPKVAAYPMAIAGYKKWHGRKKVTWFKPSRKNWSSGGLEVIVNPELGLEWAAKGQPPTRHLIKLYFKKEIPKKLMVDASLTLMEAALAPKSGVEVSFLDVQRGAFWSFSGVKKNFMPLVHGEAAGFATQWSYL